MAPVGDHEETRRSLIRGFADAVARESHVLARSPGLCWQQLANRLAWDSHAKPLIAEESQARTARGESWVRLITAPVGSSALLRTLSNDGVAVRKLAVSPDRSWVVGTHGGRIRAGFGSADVAEPFLSVWDVASGARRYVLAGHSDRVTDCAVSADGSWIVSSSWDRSVIIWDAASGAMRQRLEGFDKAHTWCVLDPGDRWVAAAGWNGTTTVWNFTTGEVLHVLHDESATNVGVAAYDGSWLATAGSDGAIKVWRLADGELMATLKGHAAAIERCLVSPDGNLIISASRDGTVRVWDVRRGVEAHRFGKLKDKRSPATVYIGACAIAPDGRWLATATEAGTLEMWDPITGGHLRTVAVGRDLPTTCWASADGTVLLAGGDGRAGIGVFDAETGQETGTLPTPERPGIMVGSRDGLLLATAGMEDSVLLWDLAVASGARAEIASTVNTLAFSPDGSFVVSTDVDSAVRLWDAESGRARQVLESGVEQARGAIAFFRDTTNNAAIASGSTTTIWDLGAGAAHCRLAGHVDPVLAIDVSPDGTWLASTDRNELRVWDARSGECLWRRRHGAGRVCLITPDGGWVVTQGEDSTLIVWDVATGRARWKSTGPRDPIWTCCLSPDGGSIVAAGKSGVVYVWDATSGQLRSSVDRQGGDVLSCVVSPDAQVMVSAGEVLDIRDLTTATERFWVNYPTGVSQCEVTPDGRSVAVLSPDGIRVWSLNGSPTPAFLPCESYAFALHPWAPKVAFADRSGGVSFAEIVGHEFGPIVLTATRTTDGATARCPRCSGVLALQAAHLGTNVACPGCGLAVSINPFVTAPARTGPPPRISPGLFRRR